MKFITKRLIGINPQLRNSSPRNQKDYRAPNQTFITQKLEKTCHLLPKRLVGINPHMGNSSPRNQKTCRAPHQNFIIPRNQKKHFIYHPKSSSRKPLHGKFITQKLESLQSPSPDIRHAEIRKNMKFITKRLIGINPHLRNSSPRNQKACRAPHQKFIITNNQKKHDIYHPKSSMRKPPLEKFITQKLKSLWSPSPEIPPWFTLKK